MKFSRWEKPSTLQYYFPLPVTLILLLGVMFQWCVLAGTAPFSAMKSKAASVMFQVLEQNLSPERHYIWFQTSWRKQWVRGSADERRNGLLKQFFK